MKKGQQYPDDQQEFPTKKEWLAFLNNDRSYEPPSTFGMNPFNEKEIWRSNNGYIEYLNPSSASKFFGLGKYKPKFSLRERKKFLIQWQDELVFFIDVLAFPASSHFFSIFSSFLMNEMYVSGDMKFHPKPNVGVQSKWYLTCMSALLLKRYFGGRIVNSKYGNLTVELEAVNFNIHIYQKVYNSESRDFDNWIYSLFYILWRCSNDGILYNEPFYFEKLDYISQRI